MWNRNRIFKGYKYGHFLGPSNRLLIETSREKQKIGFPSTDFNIGLRFTISNIPGGESNFGSLPIHTCWLTVDYMRFFQNYQCPSPPPPNDIILEDPVDIINKKKIDRRNNSRNDVLREFLREAEIKLVWLFTPTTGHVFYPVVGPQTYVFFYSNVGDENFE